ncbi:MAG: transposase [Nitrososphaeria archaeon]
MEPYAGLILPKANTESMNLHLQEISRQIKEGNYGIVVLDRAAWHTAKKLKIPSNISLLFLPPGSPELNPVENVWQYLRQNFISNLVLDIDVCCRAWNALSENVKRLISLTKREWAMV